MGHKLMETGILSKTVCAFFAFSFCASGIYLVNDLLDLPSDRQHPQKKHRPLASGDLSPSAAVFLIVLLLAASFVISFYLPRKFMAILALYVLGTTLYSSVLKKVAILDVIVLAFFYVVRILAGSMATGVPSSNWLLAFAMFFFLSLAFAKRYSELSLMKRMDSEPTKRRDYTNADLENLGVLGASSGYLSVLVLALYVNGQEVTTLYRTPSLLWLICPVILYWISRVWLLTYRGQMRDDPIVFAIKDGVSYVVVILMALIMMLAI